MKGDREDISAKVTFEQMKQEIRTETRAERRAAVTREVFEHLHSKTEVTEDEMELCIEAMLLQEPWQYRNLLELWNGNEQKAAQSVVKFMLDTIGLGDRLIMKKAMAEVEIYSAELIHLPKSEWGTD